MNSPVLPVLNIEKFYAGGDDRAAFVEMLAEAARSVGFFYLIGHNLDGLQRDVFSQSRAFFGLPLDAKRKVEMIHSPHFRGYTRLRGELTQGRPDFREQFDIMREEQALGVEEHVWQRLIGPNQWPADLPQLKISALAYQAKLTSLTLDLLHAFAEALEQPANAFGSAIDHPYTHMKLIRYPGAEAQAAAGGQGVGAHKDPGYLTIVTQDEQSGLEVEMDGRGWVSVPPIDGAVVVNIGELLELTSDGFLRATNHRVLTPPAGTDRYSVAFFMAPQLDSEVPLLDLPSHLKQLALGPSSDPNNPLFSQVGENVLKGRLRSHPDVAQLHYS